ncbi:hypothetical protein [Nostoc sp.]
MTEPNLGLKPRRLHGANNIGSQSGGRASRHKGTGVRGLNPRR